MQVGVVVPPVIRLTLQCAVDVSRAGLGHFRRLVPKVILSRNGVQRSRVCLVVSLGESGHLLGGIANDSLQLLGLRRGRGLGFRLLLGGAGQVAHGLLGQSDLGLCLGHRLGILVNGFLMRLDGLLGRVYLIAYVHAVSIQSVKCILQVIILLAQVGRRIRQYPIFLVLPVCLFGSLSPQLVHPRYGGVVFLVRRLKVVLGAGQSDAVLLRLDQHIRIGLVHGCELFLVRLGYSVLFPCLGIGPEGFGRCFQRVGRSPILIRSLTDAVR